MPPPPSERRQLQHELAELLVRLGALRDEVEAGQAGRFRRKWLAWQAEKLDRRLRALRTRWAALPTERD